MPAYTQMFDHALDMIKGWPNPYIVDFVAKISANVVKADIYGGSVVHLNADGEFEMGAKGTQMPMFLIQGATDFDVSNPGGIHWNAIAPKGNASALVAINALELETTEFEDDDAVTYAANNILHSPTEDQVTAGSEADAGKLYKRKGWTGGGDGALTLYTDAVCGIVSRGERTNSHGARVLTFWPVYLPSASA